MFKRKNIKDILTLFIFNGIPILAKISAIEILAINVKFGTELNFLSDKITKTTKIFPKTPAMSIKNCTTTKPYCKIVKIMPSIARGSSQTTKID